MKKLAIALLLLTACPADAGIMAECAALFPEKSNKPVKEGSNPRKQITGTELNAIDAALREICEALKLVQANGGSTGGGVYPTPPPTCSISPTSGPADSLLTITGTALASTGSVLFDATVASRSVASDALIYATVPAGFGTRLVSVTTTVGSANCGLFTMTEPTPEPTNLTLSATATPRIEISWTAASPEPEFGYYLSWAPDVNGVPGAWTTASIAGTSSSLTALQDIQNGTTYWVRVAGVFAGGLLGPYTEAESVFVPAIAAVVQPEGKFVCKPSQCLGASDSNSGTYAAPWATIYHGIRQINPGETLYIRGGTTDADVKPNATDSSTWYAQDPNTVWKEVLHWPVFGTYTVGAGANDGTYPATGIDEDNRVTISCYPGEFCRLQPDADNDLGWYYNADYPQPTFVLFVEGVGTANTAIPDAAQPRYITVKNLIFDARNVQRGSFKEYGRGATFSRFGPHHWRFEGNEFRYGRDENSWAAGHHNVWLNNYFHHQNAEFTAHGPCLYVESWENTIEGNRFEECLAQGVKVNNGYSPAEGSYNVIKNNTFTRIGYNSFNATRTCWNREWGLESGGQLITNWAYCPGSTAAGNTVSCTCQTQTNRDTAAAVYTTANRGTEITGNVFTGGLGTQIWLRAGTYGCRVTGNTIQNSAVAFGYAIGGQQSGDSAGGGTLSSQTGTNPSWYTPGTPASRGDMAVVGSTLPKTGVHDCYIDSNILIGNGTRGNTAPDGSSAAGQQMYFEATASVEGQTFSGNSESATPTAPPPVVSPTGGPFETGTGAITLSCEQGSAYYTTDGSTPDSGDTLYAAPIAEFVATTTLKAVCIADGYSNSPVATHVYTKALANTASFGTTTVGFEPKDAAGDQYRCQKATAGQTGTLTSHSVYINEAHADVDLKMMLYADDGGSPSKPAALIASSTGADTDGLTLGWNTIPVSSGATVTNGVTYWICMFAAEGAVFPYNHAATVSLGSNASFQGYHSGGYTSPPATLAGSSGTLSDFVRSLYSTVSY